MNLEQRAREIDAQVARLAGLRQDRKDRLTQIEEEIVKLQKESIILDKTEDVLVQLGKRTVSEGAESLNKLVTLGLKYVFPDQDLQLKTVTEKQRGKTAVRFELHDRGRTFPIDDAFGGGVLAIVGVLLRVSIITSLNLKRILLLDETLGHLADVYVPNASRLLRKLADDLGFTIVMVTHQPDYAQHAHVHLKASRRAGATIITAVDKSQSSSKKTE